MKRIKEIYRVIVLGVILVVMSGEVVGVESGTIYYNNGNFGIGTTTPGSKLHIVDTGQPGLKIESSSLTGERDALLMLMVASQGSNDPAGSVVFQDGGGARAKINASNNGGGSGGILKFYTDGGGHALVERMRIDDGGRVGIGVSNPQAKLDVQGGLYGGNYVSSRYNNSNYAVAFAATQLNGVPYIGFNTKQSGGSDGSTYDLNGCATALYGDSGSSGGLRIAVAPQGNAGSSITWTTALAVTSVGNVGIGVSSPTQKLEVGGTIKCKEVIVTLNGFADFVFEKNYQLSPLEKVEDFVLKNKHLPDFPSEKEIVSSGMSLSKMQIKLVQKIEELTLYMIKQNAKIKAIESKEKILEEKNLSLEKRIRKLEKLIGSMAMRAQ